ncbi:MAG: hypothetical protein AAGF85_20115 [Bacteroidota bacterium]
MKLQISFLFEDFLILGQLYPAIRTRLPTPKATSGSNNCYYRGCVDSCPEYRESRTSFKTKGSLPPQG